MSTLEPGSIPVPNSAPEDQQDRLYLDLKGARERLCRAQTVAPRWWTSDLQQALDIIDQAGSALAPAQWSRFDQPEVD